MHEMKKQRIASNDPYPLAEFFESLINVMLRHVYTDDIKNLAIILSSNVASSVVKEA